MFTYTYKEHVFHGSLEFPIINSYFSLMKQRAHTSLTQKTFMKFGSFMNLL